MQSIPNTPQYTLPHQITPLSNPFIINTSPAEYRDRIFRKKGKKELERGRESEFEGRKKEGERKSCEGGNSYTKFLHQAIKNWKKNKKMEVLHQIQSIHYIPQSYQAIKKLKKKKWKFFPSPLIYLHVWFKARIEALKLILAYEIICVNVYGYWCFLLLMSFLIACMIEVVKCCKFSFCDWLHG